MAEFDPAGVLAGHRRAMRAMRHDYRLAVRDFYPGASTGREDVDWTVKEQDGLVDFAVSADCLQVHPAIVQGWSQQQGPVLEDLRGSPVLGFDAVPWADLHARRVAYVHGSRNAAAHQRRYAAHYRELGHEVWTSTLDYAVGMQARYVPPTLSIQQLRARVRSSDEPLCAIQCPTDPEFCHTSEFLDACRRAGVACRIVRCMNHGRTLRHKATCHVGFDHLRGAFSVNTLENILLGLVPLVRLGVQEEAHLRALGIDWPFRRVADTDDLARALVSLDNDPSMTAHEQEAAHEWWPAWDRFTQQRLVESYS